MREKIIAGNWKMHGNRNSISQLLEELLEELPNQSILNGRCIVFPPSLYIPLVQKYLSESAIRWGAQNVYPQEEGAYTGELSGSMLKDYNCEYVLIGHSERRRLFLEGEKILSDKFYHVKKHDMIPILCIGETAEERRQGLTKDVLAQQILSMQTVDKDCFKSAIVAYEPVWAIGTGKTALPEEAQEVHAFIRELVAERSQEDANKLSILYGGSVNEKNAELLFSMPDVDGALVGGASLNARQFVEIIKCIK